MRAQEFEQLAMAEFDAVYRFARFLTRDADKADDLIQDVYARAFRPETVERFQEKGAGVRAWLMTIARNSFYGSIAHQNASVRAIDRYTSMGLHEHNESPDHAEVDGLDLGAAAHKLHDALARLSPELRDVLWLWAVEGLKYREIAESLEVPMGTVMSRLHRARAQAGRALRGDPAIAGQLEQAGFIEASGEGEHKRIRE